MTLFSMSVARTLSFLLGISGDDSADEDEDRVSGVLKGTLVQGL